MNTKDCIFCKLSANEIKRQTIYENENFFSLPDAHPVVSGHSLVISKKHFDNILEMPESLGRELIDCIKNTAMLVMKQTKSDAFNLTNNNFEAAGQVVKHVHFHIIPRKNNDGKTFDLRDTK